MITTSRKEWGARAPKHALAPFPSKPKGIKWHYAGGAVSTVSLTDHNKCKEIIRQIQKFHMEGNGWSDFAYNYAVCSHEVIIGRGLSPKSAANGNAKLNNEHYAVLILVGTAGVVQMNDAMKENAVELMQYIRTNGPCGNELKGHRDGYATDCPGASVYKWVQEGCPKPRKGEDDELKVPPTIRQGDSSFSVKTARACLFARGHVNLNPELLKNFLEMEEFTPDLTLFVKDFQTAKGLDSDGVVGPNTWRKLVI